MNYTHIYLYYILYIIYTNKSIYSGWKPTRDSLLCDGANNVPGLAKRRRWQCSRGVSVARKYNNRRHSPSVFYDTFLRFQYRWNVEGWK